MPRRRDAAWLAAGESEGSYKEAYHLVLVKCYSYPVSRITIRRLLKSASSHTCFSPWLESKFCFARSGPAIKLLFFCWSIWSQDCIQYSRKGRMKGRIEKLKDSWKDSYFSFNSLTLAPTELSWSSSLFFLLSVFLRFLDTVTKLKKMICCMHVC